MVLIDALFNGKTTEPCWFKIIRIVAAFGLLIAILLYASIQLLSILSKEFTIVITEEVIPPTMPVLKRKLAKRYVSLSGIPLSQKVSNRRNNSTLEDRVQMLETMLQDYYLDNYQWELLRKSVLKYDKLQYQYDQMMNSQHQKLVDSESDNDI
ncbi:24665_t:CDS:2, partial [Dentiscutata erythropus]